MFNPLDLHTSKCLGFANGSQHKHNSFLCLSLFTALQVQRGQNAHSAAKFGVVAMQLETDDPVGVVQVC